MSKCRCQAKLLDDGACRFGCHRFPTTLAQRGIDKRARLKREAARAAFERVGLGYEEASDGMARVVPSYANARPTYRARALRGQRTRGTR